MVPQRLARNAQCVHVLIDADVAVDGRAEARQNGMRMAASAQSAIDDCAPILMAGVT